VTGLRLLRSRRGPFWITTASARGKRRESKKVMHGARDVWQMKKEEVKKLHRRGEVLPDKNQKLR